MSLFDDAAAAGVPWSYALSIQARTDPEYRAWLAHAYVCRGIGEDPGPRPGYIDHRTVERDLDALADFSCRPLWDFAARAAAG